MYYRIIIFSAMLMMILFQACKHQVPSPMPPVGEEGDGGGGGGGNGIPCDPNVVYFEQQILPILISSCAKSGCHDAASAQDGVILNSYQNVMNTGEVEPYDLGDSDLWKVITENDPYDQMPPAGENPLTQAQINLIGQWITQGAQNLVCDDGLGPCDSVSVSFNNDVRPIMQNKCVGCHTTATSLNGMVNLSNYQGVSSIAGTGQLVGAIKHLPGYAPMPNGGPTLNTCEIAKITNWVNEGALNN